MKKYVMFFTVSIFGFTAGISYAQNADKHIQMLKDTFGKEFQSMDLDNNGKISKEEYINYQLKNVSDYLQKSSESQETSEKTVKPQEMSEKTLEPQEEIKPVKPKAQPEDELSGLAEVNKTLQAMADFDVDMDLNETWLEDKEPMAKVEKLINKPQPKELSQNDKISDKSQDDKTQKNEEDLPTSEDEKISAEIESMLSQLELNEEKLTKAEPNKPAMADDAIQNALKALKSSLPQKIDDATTWTDIKYQDKSITYIYNADIDTVSYSPEEKKNLTKSITEEACPKAYKELCPQMKTAFMDKGLEVSIRYFDKQSQEIGTCVFNQETCK